MKRENIFTNPDTAVDYIDLFESLPGSCILLQIDAPHYTILAATPEYLLQTSTTKDNLIGKGMFAAFPSNPNDPTDTGTNDVRASLDQVRLLKIPHRLPVQRYDVAGQDGQLSETYWSAVNKPVFGRNGDLAFIIHTAENITSLIKSDEREVEYKELQQVYRRVKASESKYSTLFNSMDQGFCIIEMIYDEHNQPIDYLFIEINPVFEKHTGLRGVSGKSVKQLVPSLEAHWFERYSKVALTGKSTRFEDRSEAMGRWFDVSAFPVGDNDSRRVALLFTDITEQKKAGEMIIQSELRFRSMVEQAPVAISISRGENMVIEVANERMLRMVNQSKDIIGKPFLEAMPEMKDQPILEVLRNIFKTGEPFSGNEVLLPLKNGNAWEERYFNVVYQPLVEEGRVTGIINVATEVTEQVHARKKIEESQQRFYSLANSITQLAWIADEKGWIFWYNDRWFDYTGTTIEEMKGWGWEKVHHPDHIARVVSFVKDAWNKDEPWELIFPLRRKDGQYRWFLTRVVPVHNKEGEVVQWIGTNTDIDDQKQAEALLEHRVRERTIELEMRNRELEQFTHVSHHDLQEPLRKIMFFTNMVKVEEAQRLSQSSLVTLDKVSKAAVRMSAALKDVLHFASLSKSEQFVAVDLNEVLTGVLSDLELLISEKKATIKSHALPVITGVPTQMHQLFYNLVNNALKFAKPGESPRIIISCKMLNQSHIVGHLDLDQSKKYYDITIQDNGIGFNPHHAEKIFDMFQRLHSRDAYSGTGIGLALVKKVILNHGGKIWAEGKEGKGATFKIVLPIN